MSLAETLTFSFMVGAGIVIALVFLVSVFNTLEKINSSSIDYDRDISMHRNWLYWFKFVWNCLGGIVMKKYIIAVLISLPTWFWLSYFCGLNNIELIATAFILGVTLGIYKGVLEETDK
ncbi:hypothetical protein CN604_24740 [Bacillus wiedmannii]|uniref:hypothetical protein n=1 Tax=Bacillus wiedmannii TaxID=1890302 RepID=UPI000BF2384B|nr:hypothetical protein [Bacillus wiedmannii]PEL95787.1 hypothetical protein CN604_24740 [Bacillus wiedmannii]